MRFTFVKITDLDCVTTMNSALNQRSSYEIADSLGLSIVLDSSLMDQRDFGVLRELPVWSSVMFGVRLMSQMISTLQKNSLASRESFGKNAASFSGFYIMHHDRECFHEQAAT